MKENTQLDYSPKLKEAMAEIKAVLKKHDIAAHVLLHEPGYSEYLNAIEPSWSLIRIVDDGIRVRSKLLEDFGGDKEAQHKASEATASLIRHFADVLYRDAEVFESLHAMLIKHWDITYSGGVHTPHRDN
jgi:hypothetical protein